jgi:hypothetical protein
MAEALVVDAGSRHERTPLSVRLRWAFHRSRSAILPRRWVIPWEMRDNGRYYASVIAEAEARRVSRDDTQALKAEEAHYYWELEEERAMLESSRLLRQAGTYMLPTPEVQNRDDDPNWQQGNPRGAESASRTGW